MMLSIVRFQCLSGLLGLLLCLAGCASAPVPFEYHSEIELKSGPGLFSGEDGVFTLYERDSNAKESQKKH